MSVCHSLTNNNNNIYLRIPGFVCEGVTWLGWWGVLGAILGSVDLLKSSSMSRTLESRDLEEVSLMSSSFIFLAIMIVFLVIFSPGRAILSSQGSHCRKTRATLKIILHQSKCLHFSYPFRHLVGVGHPVMVVEDHDCGHTARGDHEHDGSEVCPC